MCRELKKDTRIDFLYLSEQDMLEAGVMDMTRCIDTEANVMQLLVEGDYLEGGPNGNSHGIMMEFPRESHIQDFPLDDERDRRFMAMPAYLGGKYHLIGEKWYGSNPRNQKKGLPRSILTVMLNDVESGAPIALMSANVLSAVRTGCMPGLAARYLAKEHPKVLTSIGAGVMAKTSILAIMSACSGIEELRIKGSSPTSKSAGSCKSFIEKYYPKLKITISSTLEEAVTGADIITECVTVGKVKERPFISPEWITPGALLISSSCLLLPEEFLAKEAKTVVDNIGMYEGYLEDHKAYLKAHPEEAKKPDKPSVSIGMNLIKMREKGLITTDDIAPIGKIIKGEVSGRTSQEEIIVAGFDGMPVLDVAWGYECYQKALEKGIGTRLNLWDTPFLA